MDNTDLDARMKAAQKARLEMIDKVCKWIHTYVWLGAIAYVLGSYLSH